MNAPLPPGSQKKVLEAIGILLVVAVGTRIASSLLAPLVPILLVTGLLGLVTWYLFSRHH